MLAAPYPARVQSWRTRSQNQSNPYQTFHNQHQAHTSASPNHISTVIYTPRLSQAPHDAPLSLGLHR